MAQRPPPARRPIAAGEHRPQPFSGNPPPCNHPSLEARHPSAPRGHLAPNKLCGRPVCSRLVSWSQNFPSIWPPPLDTSQGTANTAPGCRGPSCSVLPPLAAYIAPLPPPSSYLRPCCVKATLPSPADPKTRRAPLLSRTQPRPSVFSNRRPALVAHHVQLCIFTTPPDPRVAAGRMGSESASQPAHWRSEAGAYSSTCRIRDGRQPALCPVASNGDCRGPSPWL